jgi:hypothetical protein
MGLRTADPIFARRRVVLLDAKLEEIATAFEQSAMHLTPPQVDGLLRDVVTTHLHKLERLAAAAKSFSAFDAAQAASDDRRTAWCYRLLHAQGPSAVVRPPNEEHMSADGMTAADIAAVRDHLAMLRINNLVPTRHGILQKLLDANGAPANAINMAMAQDVYFRGMWMALSQSERRYGGHIVEADDFMEQIFLARRQAKPEVTFHIFVGLDAILDGPTRWLRSFSGRCGESQTSSRSIDRFVDLSDVRRHSGGNRPRRVGSGWTACILRKPL